MLKKKLEEARASVGQQRPNEPEGEPKKKKEEDKSKRDLSQVKPEWLIEKKARRSDETWSEAGSERSGRYEGAPYGVPTCFYCKLYCKQSGHKATNCKQMREDARVAGASQLPDGDSRMFCLICYKFFKFVRADRNRPMIGWGTRTSDRCWYASEVAKYEEDEKKKKEEAGKKEEATKKAPNPACGKERMISRSGLKDPEAGAQVEVKDSDDDEQMKEKEKQEAAGSSRDPPKKDKNTSKEKKEDKKKKEKKRRASDSSEVIEASAKRRKEKKKEKTSDLE